MLGGDFKGSLRVGLVVDIGAGVLFGGLVVVREGLGVRADFVFVLEGLTGGHFVRGVMRQDGEGVEVDSWFGW